MSYMSASYFCYLLKFKAEDDVWLDKYLVKVQDMYALYIRVKKVKSSYELFWNMKSRKYEIHDTSNKACSLCLVIGSSELDARVIEKLFRTRKENMKKLFLQMEEENRRLEGERKRAIFEQASCIMSDALEYAERTGSDLGRECIGNIIKTNKGESYA